MNENVDGRSKPSPLSDVESILTTLPAEKRQLYVQTLYSIAKTAMESGCRSLRLMDVEILTSLEVESNANFEEWLHQACIGQ